MEPNFIIVKSPDPVGILLETFPELEDLQQDDEYDDAYYVYGRFAEYLSSKIDDEQLWQRAYEFLEVLATGGSVLRGLLTEIVETLDPNGAAAQKLKTNVGPAVAVFLA
jgi:hypothetical protein